MIILMHNKAKALRLFGNLAVLERIKKKDREPGTNQDKTEYTKDVTRKFKVKNAKSKRKREEEARISEKVQISKDWRAMKRIAIRSNAGLRHISVFINLIEYAKDNDLSVTINEMRKRLKPEDAVKEWDTIRGWCGKNAPEMCAISIGRKPKGWWSIRVLVVGGEEDEDCDKPVFLLRSYLMLKRGWVTSDHAGSKEAKNLEEHYLTRLASDEATFELYVFEMYEVYRASLSVPNSSRTYRTERVEGVLEARKLDVDEEASYVVNGGGHRNSPSGRALCEVDIKENRVVDAWWIAEPLDEDNEFITED